jgi:transcriptional regulator with XRE-family HTH domain
MKLTQAEMIQILRRRANLNQGDFGARAFGTSFESGRTKVKNIELGKQSPTLNDVEKMAAVLGIDTDELLVTDDAKAAPNASTLADNGLTISAEVMECFPGLEAYLGMLNQAVKLEDSELIDYITDKLSEIFSGFDKSALRQVNS